MTFFSFSPLALCTFIPSLSVVELSAFGVFSLSAVVISGVNVVEPCKIITALAYRGCSSSDSEASGVFVVSVC